MEGFVNYHKKETLSQAWQVDKDLKACLKELYDKKLWTDVKIHCKDHIDGECFLAHKVVLAARSPVFQSMFFGTCADGKDEIYLDKVDTNAFHLFLRYLYSDDLTLSEENASSLLEIAHFYQVLNLVDMCADFLATIITVKNAFEVLNVSTFYELITLRNACYAFIDTHADEILQSEEFLQLSADRLHYILKGDTFYTDEKIIFTKVIQWEKNAI
ncbi:BTB/POZ domain-containing protein 6-B-like [Ruditapes philippinarum]|uniref:BTB/POZ domain-containing protein 6-B-like n=1 Tax=Ruditapes philippinarum TaxID=129788 RepID=UPI00295A5806|nr:BTB/POZ domain-containing protein 6-B-like [Ruditapes philippinarum]